MAYSRKLRDVVGERFGKWVVIERCENTSHGVTRFLCKCDCGTVRAVRSAAIRSGRSKSCGCAYKDEPPILPIQLRHPEYGVWLHMRSRCSNPARKEWVNYGGRGITVCERWKSFEAFLSDMGPRPTAKHSIDRIDNNGNYEPGNCRWATRTENNRNARDNIMVTFRGETMCVTAWAERVGISGPAMHYRLKEWGIDRAILTPRANYPPRGRRP